MRLTDATFDSGKVVLEELHELNIMAGAIDRFPGSVQKNPPIDTLSLPFSKRHELQCGKILSRIPVDAASNLQNALEWTPLAPTGIEIDVDSRLDNLRTHEHNRLVFFEQRANLRQAVGTIAWRNVG